MKKKIVYVDMDNTIVDFKSGIEKLSKEDQEKFKDNFDDHPEIFSLMEPIDGAIEALKKLNNHFDLYMLSTAPWDNPNAWKHKREWVERYFGKGKENIFYKKVILSHHKNLNKGDILIDDRPNNGAENFKGKWIQFGSHQFPNWDSVVKQLTPKHRVTKPAVFIAVTAMLFFLAYVFIQPPVTSPNTDSTSNSSSQESEEKPINSSDTTTSTVNYESTLIENFEKTYRFNYINNPIVFSEAERSITWMGNSLYFWKGGDTLSGEPSDNFYSIYVDGQECIKTVIAKEQAYLSEFYPGNREIKLYDTYVCDENKQSYLFGEPFYQDMTWWIFQTADFDFTTIQCEESCKPSTTLYAKKVKIDETTEIYNLYNPISLELWSYSEPWIQYIDYMWEIYWLFDWVDIDTTNIADQYRKLFLTPAFQISVDGEKFECYLYGGVGMTGPEWLDGLFPQPLKTVTKEQNYLVGGPDWSWSCFIGERKDEENVHIKGSGPPIVLNNSSETSAEITDFPWVMYGTPKRPNDFKQEEGVFYEIIRFYWFYKDPNNPSIDFACQYIKDEAISYSDTYKTIYQECSENN